MTSIRRTIYLIWISLITFHLVNGQNSNLPKNPETFGKEVKQLLSVTNNETATLIGANFDSLWTREQLSAVHQEMVMDIAQTMHEKQFKIRPAFEHFFGAINAAVYIRALANETMTALLETTVKVVGQYDKKQASKFLSTVKSFLENETLYQKNGYSVKVPQGSFTFRFVEDTEAFEEAEKQGFFEEEAVEEEQAEIDWSSINWDEISGSSEVTVEEAVQETYVPEQPPIQGAVIEFSGADVVLAGKYDASAIKNTNGSYLFETEQFIGKGGTMDWSNTDLPSDEVFASLETYDFKVSDNRLTAENVMLQYEGVLEKPVKGVLVYAAENKKNKRPSYPGFKSYYSDIKLKNIGADELLYTGGFALRGAKIYSASAYGEFSVLEGYKGKEKRFKAVSPLFNFNEGSTITANISAVVIYQNGDSISHPAVRFHYRIDQSLLTLRAAKGGFKDTPYHTSYFNMDITADMIQWDIHSDSIDISTIAARDEKPVLAESQDFFSTEKFENLAGLYNFHPLLVMINYSRKINSHEFYVEGLSQDIKVREELMKKVATDLMQKGLVFYNKNTGLIKITRKGYHHALSNMSRKDFDDIIIPSVINTAPNATLNLENNTLKMRGVRTFYVSDSLDVTISPKNGEVRILKNRDIQFDGSLNAGNFEFSGHEFVFKYDSFLVDLPQIDSIRLKITSNDGDRKRLENQLVETSGRLIINKPFNKSAKRNYPQYPIFDLSQNATVYFDEESELDVVYDSTVFFDVAPFALDSAAHADPSTMTFEGVFTSGGIFPNFKEDLTVMPDNSLGFVHQIPPEGYSLYGMDARIFDHVRLDEKGLTSTGNIHHLTGKFSTERTFYYLDSVIAERGIKATIDAGISSGVSFPSVSLSDYKLKWLTKKDSMQLTSEKDPFGIYDESADFEGTLVLTSKGLRGGGDFIIESSEVSSGDFTFKENDFLARNAEFQIKSNTPEKPVLQADDIRLYYSLSEQMATIQPEEEGVAALEFPFAQFKTSIPTAKWEFSKKLITMEKPQSIDISKSYFYTTREDLDSLAFNATGAVYDIENLTLKIEGIPYITVADAKITPKNNEVLVLENAKIGTLSDAVVVIDTANSYHRLYDATINIVSRNEFNGEATYELVNTVQDTFAIKFNAFVLEEDEVRGKFTKSSGHVRPKDNVMISPGFIFKGKVSMYGYKKALELDGAVKLDLKKLRDKNIWVEYTSNDDIQEVIVDFDQAVTENGEPLNAGLHFNDGDVYLSFITEKRDYDDEDFFIPSGGNLFYDADTNAFKIENALKAAGQQFSGSMFSYNEETQDVSFEGKLNFISKNSPGANVQSAGIGKGNLNTSEFEVDALMALDYEIPDEGITLMAADLKAMGEKLGVRRAHEDRSLLIYKVAELIGDKATKDWDEFSLSTYTPLVNMSPILLKDIVISTVNFRWSKQNSAFYSIGKIGLSNVGNVDLNVEVDGLIDIRKTPEGDMVNILLQMTDGTWYYFGYDGSTLASFSSNQAYNEVILSKSNIGKAKLGAFNFFAATLEEVSIFARNFKKLYYGIDEPYRLLMANESAQQLKKEIDEEEDGF